MEADEEYLCPHCEGDSTGSDAPWSISARINVAPLGYLGQARFGPVYHEPTVRKHSVLSREQFVEKKMAHVLVKVI